MSEEIKAQIFLGELSSSYSHEGMRNAFLICVFGLKIKTSASKNAWWIHLICEGSLWRIIPASKRENEHSSWVRSDISWKKTTFMHFLGRLETTMYLLMHSKSFPKSEQANPGKTNMHERAWWSSTGPNVVRSPFRDFAFLEIFEPDGLPVKMFFFPSPVCALSLSLTFLR